MSLGRRLAPLALAAALAAGTTGCAPGIAGWIARTRDHQGDVALSDKNDAGASKAYQLALAIDPHDPHALHGLMTVQLRIAQEDFALSKFDDAIAALDIAARHVPGDPQVAGLRAEIEQAQVQREIVISNYPAYQLTGLSIQHGYALLKDRTAAVAAALKRFDYTFDTTDLTTAIRESYTLSDEVARLTNRLVQYRQLVESGVPEHEEQPLAPPASLLPLP